MLGFLEISLVFCAVLMLCALYVFRFNGNSATAPLFVISYSMLHMSIFAGFNQLALGAASFFALAIAAFLYMLFQRKKLSFKNSFFTPGMVFFIAGSLFFMALYAVRQPIFTEWDEFSFWGVAPKLVTVTGQMYSAVESSLRAVTFTPGLIAYDYLFQSFGEFAPWKVYCAYNIMYLSVFAAALAPFSKKEKRAHAAPLALFCFLAPFLCTEYLRLIYVSPVYRGALSDIPLGIMFGAALVAYFAAEEKDLKTMLVVIFTLACEALVKDMGFALSLVGAGIIAWDYLFVENGLEHFKQALQKTFKPILSRLGWCAAFFATPVVAFMGWSLHLKNFLNLDRTDIGGEQEMQMVEMLVTGVKELFSSNKSEKFSAVMDAMIDAFLNEDITLFGSGLCMCAVIGLLLLIAFIAWDKKGKIRTAWFSLLSAGGFLVFYIFTGFTYVYVFKGADGYGLVSYNRYIYPYYIGWLLAAALLAFTAVHAQVKRTEEDTARGAGSMGFYALALYVFGVLPYVFIFRKVLSGVAYQSFAAYKGLIPLYYALWAALGIALFIFARCGKLNALRADAHAVRLACKGVLLIVVAASTLRWASCVRPELCFINYPDSHESTLRNRSESVAQETAVIGEDERTFFVWQGDDGFEWFSYCYEFLPRTLDYSFGGGTLGTPELGGAIAMTQEDLCEYLVENDCSYIYLGNIDDLFINSYASLFEDGLENWNKETMHLYKVCTENGQMSFAPVLGEGE